MMSGFISSAFESGYENILKPILFRYDAETVHDVFTNIGSAISKSDSLLKLTEKFLAYHDSGLKRKINGLVFDNPVGLAAGFDYNGYMARTMRSVGFGFNTIGTVTAKPYNGNQKPRLTRLIKSQSILVNKGFKSLGVVEVEKILDRQNKIGKGFNGQNLGVSIGSTNTQEIDTVRKAIDDYLFTFNYLKNKDYVKYFEVNISCPNTKLPESFGVPKNFDILLTEITKLNIKKPLFIKLANEINFDTLDEIIKICFRHKINTVIMGNLLKSRDSTAFNKYELSQVANLNGNFSGKPTYHNSNERIKYLHKKFNDDLNIIGCGGIFSAKDTLEKLNAGACAVQLITGMIFKGPQVIGQINKELSNYN